MWPEDLRHPVSFGTPLPGAVRIQGRGDPRTSVRRHDEPDRGVRWSRGRCHRRCLRQRGRRRLDRRCRERDAERREPAGARHVHRQCHVLPKDGRAGHPSGRPDGAHRQPSATRSSRPRSRRRSMSSGPTRPTAREPRRTALLVDMLPWPTRPSSRRSRRLPSRSWTVCSGKPRPRRWSTASPRSRRRCRPLIRESPAADTEPRSL